MVTPKNKIISKELFPTRIGIKSRQQKLKLCEILKELKDSSRFSEKTLDFFENLIMEGSPSTESISLYDSEFWKRISNGLAYLNNSAYPERLVRAGIDTYEIKELIFWTKDNVRSINKLKIRSAKINTLVFSDFLFHSFREFIDGNVKYLNKIFRSGKLSKKVQEFVKSEISLTIIDSIKISNVITSLNKNVGCFESIIFKEDAIVIIRSSKVENLRGHIKHSIELLEVNEIDNSNSENGLDIGDIITDLEAENLEKVIEHLNNIGNDFGENTIKFHQISTENTIISYKLPWSIVDRISNAIFKGSLERLKASDEKTQQWFKNLFAAERTFVLTNDPSGWVKQAKSFCEKLDMWINIECVLTSGGSIDEVKRVIKINFRNWDTLKHSKDRNIISGVSIEEWVNSLENIVPDKLGFQLKFDFNVLRRKVSGRLIDGKTSFLNRFDSIRSHHKYTPDRWDGVIYDKLGTEGSRFSQNFVYRVRKNIASNKKLLEQAIQRKMDEIASRDLRDLIKLFNKNKFLESIWKKAGNLSPRQWLESQVKESMNPLQQLKNISVRFEIVDPSEIIIDSFEDYIKGGGTYHNFLENFNNQILITKVTNVRNHVIAKTIKCGKAYKYLSSRTLKEVPVPRYSKSRDFVFASLTNENERCGAIRVFLDLITRSEEGRDLLLEIEMVSKETRNALKRKNGMKFVIDWETGTQTSNKASQITGIIDGIVALEKQGKYSDEFIVEFIGYDKGTRVTAREMTRDNPFSTVIGDLLRIACYNAAGKPGIVVYGHFDNSGDLIYTIMKFNSDVINTLKKAEAQFAVDINRKNVKEIIQQGQPEIINLFNKIFKMTSDLDFPSDLFRYIMDSPTNIEVYELFGRIIKRIAC